MAFEKRMLSGLLQILLPLGFLGFFSYYMYGMCVFMPINDKRAVIKGRMVGWGNFLEYYSKQNGHCLLPEKDSEGHDVLPVIKATYDIKDENYKYSNDGFSQKGSLKLRYQFAVNGKETTALLYSCGPDKYYDLDTAGLTPLSSETEFWKFEYDPTNGFFSKGDIYYIRKIGNQGL
jgi:hypothetical protein